jgi:hypothetical protein
MKLVDTDETVVLVIGASITAAERDLPLAQMLQAEIDRRGDGLAYRRAVLVNDTCYLENRPFHAYPTTAIGGPGANGVSQEFSSVLPTLYNRLEQVFVQADFEGEAKRAAVWGVTAGHTEAAVQVFMTQGFLDDLLGRIWRFRAEIFV